MFKWFFFFFLWLLEALQRSEITTGLARGQWGAVGVAWKGRLSKAAADTNPPLHALSLVLSPGLSSGGQVGRWWRWQPAASVRAVFLWKTQPFAFSWSSRSAKPDFPRVSPKPSLTLLKGNRFSTSLAVLTLSLVCSKPVLPLLLRKPWVCSGCFYTWNQVPGPASGDVAETCALVSLRQVSL